jgi:hypothetical protein
MHGGWQLFNPTLLMEVEESLLIRWVALTGPSEAGHGGARRWAWVHNVCVNSPLKSSPKPHRFATSFYHLFLL